MDSVMLGSLAFYRKLLQKTIFATQPMGISQLSSNTLTSATSRRDGQNLSLIGHGLAGILAGTTVSFVAAPVEQIKARLQVQYSPNKQERFYTSPIDCLNKIYQSHGFRGWYHGLTATLIFRSFFFFWWSSYEGFTRLLVQHTNLSTPVINFWAGGLSAQIFWLTSYPSDVVKQRVMNMHWEAHLGTGLGTTIIGEVQQSLCTERVASKAIGEVSCPASSGHFPPTPWQLWYSRVL